MTRDVRVCRHTRTTGQRPTSTDRGNQWYVQKRLELIDAYGGKCIQCGSVNDLQFAHVRPTRLTGMSRGRNARVLDVLHHPESYALLCRVCNRAMEGYDQGSAQALNSREH